MYTASEFPHKEGVAKALTDKKLLHITYSSYVEPFVHAASSSTASLLATLQATVTVVESVMIGQSNSVAMTQAT